MTPRQQPPPEAQVPRSWAALAAKLRQASELAEALAARQGPAAFLAAPPPHPVASLAVAPMASRRGPRVLCLDGGGIRGLLMVEALKRVERMTGRRIAECFDLICGTSTGGMIACSLCCGRTLPEIEVQYEAIRQSFVAQSPLVAEVKRYAMGTSHSGETADSVLREFYGATRMSDLPPQPRCFVLTASVAVSPPQPYLFRSYEVPKAMLHRAEIMGTSSVAIAEAVRATTSAPTYYEAARVGGSQFVDGAVLQNNPAIMALTEAALLWPGVPIEFMLSIGTGTNLPKPYTPQGVMGWVKTMLDLAMSSDLTARLAAMLVDGDRYVRLDVEGGADICDLAEMREEVVARMVAEGCRYYDRKADVFERVRAALV